MTVFNAWDQPWIPVIQRDGAQTTLSLCDTLLVLHELKDFGWELTPLDLDSMYRFLAAIVGVVARSIDHDDWQDDKAIPDYAVKAFGDMFRERFNISGERPFLQRWDKTGTDIEAQIAPKKSIEDTVHALDQLHPHEPGGSSSQWAIRHDARDAGDLSTLTLLLVTAWFQTKNGNGQDPWGGKASKGSASTWHTNPMAIYYTHEDSLAKTVFANIPLAWFERSDLPVFLSRDLPDDFATVHTSSVSRFTYAKTLPLIYWEDGRPLGFVIGPDSGIEVPLLDKDEKTSLGVIHEHDHTRLYVETASKSGAIILKPRGSFGGRLTSTEGFERWFRADNGVAKAIESWQTRERFLNPADADLPNWSLSVFSETTDGKGTRNWVAWDVMPADFATAKGIKLSAIQTLFGFASECRKYFYTCGRTATGESRDVPAFIVGQAAFYSSLMPVIAELVADFSMVQAEDSNASEEGLRRYAQQIRDVARIEFDATSGPFLTPSRVADVARARAQFRRLTGAAFAKRFPSLESSTTKEVS